MISNDTNEKVDRLCTDTAVLASVQNEMSKRLDDVARSIEILNHNSTETKVDIAECKIGISGVRVELKAMEKRLESSMRMGIGVVGIFLTILFFVVNFIMNYLRGI